MVSGAGYAADLLTVIQANTKAASTAGTLTQPAPLHSSQLDGAVKEMASPGPLGRITLDSYRKRSGQKKAGVPYFAPDELRHTFATRLSAGGVADHMVARMLRQSDAEVFRLYSQAKLGIMGRRSRSWTVVSTILCKRSSYIHRKGFDFKCFGPVQFVLASG